MSLKDALAGVRQSQAEQTSVTQTALSEAPVQAPRPRTSKTSRPKADRIYGKSSNPDFEKIGVYVRTNTRRKAERKWEDQAGGDLSDLIESLLVRYANS